MIKKLLLAALAVGVVSAMTLQTAPAEADTMAGMTCKDAAKARFPDDRKMRHTYKKECKEAWKLSQGK